uniref:MP n=1 Tax=Castanea betaflexivirus 1 TaxID=2794402 RepID=A0A7T5QZA7_9VIRU|nr:MP [Castanea betaflexivirus 1]
MSIINTNELIAKIEKGSKAVDAIPSGLLYKDSGYGSNKTMDILHRCENAISVESPDGAESIITGVPIIDLPTLEGFRKNKKYRWVHIVAIPVSIHSLLYSDKSYELTGECCIMDKRFLDGRAIMQAFKFDISEESAHYVFYPNLKLDKMDPLFTEACQIYIKFNNTNFKQTARPFAVEIGSIYRLANSIKTLTKIGRGITAEFMALCHTQQIPLTNMDLKYKQVLAAELRGRGAYQLTDVETDYAAGNRGKLLIWRKQGPRAYKTFKVEPKIGQQLKRSCSIRSNWVEPEEREEQRKSDFSRSLSGYTEPDYILGSASKPPIDSRGIDGDGGAEESERRRAEKEQQFQELRNFFQSHNIAVEKLGLQQDHPRRLGNGPEETNKVEEKIPAEESLGFGSE